MLKNCTLLYVEDDKDMQEYMKILLEDKVKELIIAEEMIMISNPLYGSNS